MSSLGLERAKRQQLTASPAKKVAVRGRRRRKGRDDTGGSLWEPVPWAGEDEVDGMIGIGEFATPESVIRREGLVPFVNAYQHLKGIYSDGKIKDPFMRDLFANAEKGTCEAHPSSSEIVNRSEARKLPWGSCQKSASTPEERHWR